MPNRIDSFLELVVKQEGSDLHLVSGNPPRIRLFGEMFPIKYRELSEEENRELLYEIMNSRQREDFENAGDLDFAYEVPGLSRFRVNVFNHLDGIGAVFRSIPSEVQALDSLGLPPLCCQEGGVLVE